MGLRPDAREHGDDRNGGKTRRFERILLELERTWRIHEACGSHLGGVYFELTGKNVTECVGGACGLTAEDLSRDTERNWTCG